MGRRGNPYDNAKAESFMKTLKVEAIYRMDYQSFADVADDLPLIIDEVLQRQAAALRSRLSERCAVRGATHAHQGVKTAA